MTTFSKKQKNEHRSMGSGARFVVRGSSHYGRTSKKCCPFKHNVPKGSTDIEENARDRVINERDERDKFG